MFSGNVMFLFISKPKPQPREFSESLVEQQAQLEDTEHAPSFLQLIKSTCRLMMSKKMMLLNPELWWTGVSIAVYSGILTPIIIY